MIRIYYEEYYNDCRRTNHTRDFTSLQELEDWIFGQMRQKYSDKEHGWLAMSFPVPEVAERVKSDGPWGIEFKPEYGGVTYWIHKIERGHGIIFSDGKHTDGRKHWSKEVQEWLIHCKERQYNPQFEFED